MKSPAISGISELSLIEEIRREHDRKSRFVKVGIGDDAAVIAAGGKHLLITTDMMIEGVHFDLRFATAYQVGFKLVSVNVSDIYAMGGIPHHMLLNIAMHRRTPLEFIHMLLSGVKDALAYYRTALVGGDLSASRGAISLSATLVGSAGKYILRSGARVGDNIYVTGTLGDSGCGLALLKKLRRTIPVYLDKAHPGMNSLWKEIRARNIRFRRSDISWETVEPLVRRHLLPEARNPREIIRCATSMIDISDGLLIDLTRICNESGTGARIYEERIPVSAEMLTTAKYLGVAPLKLALTGGEDYELLFTAPGKKKITATYIGDITEGEKIIVRKSGRERAFSAEGYQHFR